MRLLAARVPQEDVPALYGRLAWVYDVWAALTESRARVAGLAAAQLRDGERVLEVAVGTGLLYRELLHQNPTGHTEGVDLTEAMLARARKKVAGHRASHRLQVGDARRLPFEAQHFDLALNGYLFDLLPEADFPVVLDELWRVLKPGGRLVLVNMALAERPWERVYEGLYRLNPRWMGGCRGVELAPFVRQQGFVAVEVQRLTQMGFPSEILRAQRPRPA